MGMDSGAPFCFFFSRSAAVAAQVFRLARPNLSSEPLLADAASAAAAPCSSSSGLVVGSSELFRDGLHPLAPHHYGRRHAEQHHALPPPRREPPPPKKSSWPPSPLSSSSDLAVSLEDCNCFQASSFLLLLLTLFSTPPSIYLCSRPSGDCGGGGGGLSLVQGRKWRREEED